MREEKKEGKNEEENKKRGIHFGTFVLTTAVI
jgi:hypothetical protein